MNVFKWYAKINMHMNFESTFSSWLGCHGAATRLHLWFFFLFQAFLNIHLGVWLENNFWLEAASIIGVGTVFRKEVIHLIGIVIWQTTHPFLST